MTCQHCGGEAQGIGQWADDTPSAQVGFRERAVDRLRLAPERLGLRRPLRGLGRLFSAPPHRRHRIGGDERAAPLNEPAPAQGGEHVPEGAAREAVRQHAAILAVGERQRRRSVVVMRRAEGEAVTPEPSSPQRLGQGSGGAHSAPSPNTSAATSTA